MRHSEKSESNDPTALAAAAVACVACVDHSCVVAPRKTQCDHACAVDTDNCLAFHDKTECDAAQLNQSECHVPVASDTCAYACFPCPSRDLLCQDAELRPHRIDPNSIKDIRLLGSGGFGDVWLVRLSGKTLAASKRLRSDRYLDPHHIQQFVAEIKLNATLDHPQIVKFLGVAWTCERDLQALFEYMPKRDLRQWLRKHL